MFSTSNISVLIKTVHLEKFSNVSTKRSAYDIWHKMKEIVKDWNLEAPFGNLFSL
jgi:hypothetical protein